MYCKYCHLAVVSCSASLQFKLIIFERVTMDYKSGVLFSEKDVWNEQRTILVDANTEHLVCPRCNPLFSDSKVPTPFLCWHSYCRCTNFHPSTFVTILNASSAKTFREVSLRADTCPDTAAQINSYVRNLGAWNCRARLCQGFSALVSTMLK